MTGPSPTRLLAAGTIVAALVGAVALAPDHVRSSPLQVDTAETATVYVFFEGLIAYAVHPDDNDKMIAYYVSAPDFEVEVDSQVLKAEKHTPQLWGPPYAGAVDLSNKDIWFEYEDTQTPVERFRQDVVPGTPPRRAENDAEEISRSFNWLQRYADLGVHSLKRDLLTTRTNLAATVEISEGRMETALLGQWPRPACAKPTAIAPVRYGNVPGTHQVAARAVAEVMVLIREVPIGDTFKVRSRAWSDGQEATEFSHTVTGPVSLMIRNRPDGETFDCNASVPRPAVSAHFAAFRSITETDGGPDTRQYAYVDRNNPERWDAATYQQPPIADSVLAALLANIDARLCQVGDSSCSADFKAFLEDEVLESDVDAYLAQDLDTRQAQDFTAMTIWARPICPGGGF